MLGIKCFMCVNSFNLCKNFNVSKYMKIEIKVAGVRIENLGVYENQCVIFTCEHGPFKVKQKSQSKKVKKQNTKIKMSIHIHNLRRLSWSIINRSADRRPNCKMCFPRLPCLAIC